MSQKMARGLFGSIRFSKPKEEVNLLKAILDALGKEVKKIQDEIKVISENTTLSFQDKPTQYKSSDELWRYYK